MMKPTSSPKAIVDNGYRPQLAEVQKQALQPDADAYGQELAHAGIGHEQADDIVAKLEAGAVTGAHTWISKSSAPHGSEERCEDGWHAGVRDVASYLLRIADTTATTGRGLAASSATLAAHLQRPDSPAPGETPVEGPDPAPAPVPPLEAKHVLAAAERFPWAVAAPDARHWPDGGDFLDVALSAVRPEEREGYIERLQAFVEQHHARLEEMLRTHGPGSRPASHDRYALVRPARDPLLHPASARRRKSAPDPNIRPDFPHYQ
ncbi:chromosomal replication initiator protein DnaA [Streptomyces eurythermus]|uniref:hypothetical protein n=1 Tax=Streptomyces eurythermus TaxID=42237 RepID=UPI0036F529D4